jgi:hypothetical protein
MGLVRTHFSRLKSISILSAKTVFEMRDFALSQDFSRGPTHGRELLPSDAVAAQAHVF